MSNKGKIPAALENQTNIIIDEEPLSSPGLTNEQLEKARYILDAVSTFDGTLPECREKLISMSVHPVLEGKIPEPSQELVVESKNIGDELQENTRVEFELTAGELYGEDVDWNADQDEFEDINEVPIDHPSQNTCSVGATVQPGSALPDNQPQLTEQKNQQMSQGNNPSAPTKIKRCANPFASLK